MFRPWCCSMRSEAHALFAGTALLAATPAIAQTYTVSTIVAPAYGNVASGASGDTVFRNTGTVTRQSGSGGWISGTVRRATITIACVNGTGTPAACATSGNNARIQVGTSGVTSGRAGAITDFTVSSGTGTVGAGTTSGPGPLDFILSGWTAAGSKTFFIDTTMPISGDNIGGATGAATSGFFVRAAKDPAVPATGLSGLATATVRRSLQIVKQSDLQLGVIIRPATSSGLVLINNSTGLRTASGTGTPGLLPGLPVGRALYTITGEPSTTFTITVPASVVMASGANNLTVTLTKTATGSQTMPAGGTLDLGVGSSTPIASTTPQGDYSGTFTVTITYN